MIVSLEQSRFFFRNRGILTTWSSKFQKKMTGRFSYRNPWYKSNEILDVVTSHWFMMSHEFNVCNFWGRWSGVSYMNHDLHDYRGTWPSMFPLDGSFNPTIVPFRMNSLCFILAIWSWWGTCQSVAEFRPPLYKMHNDSTFAYPCTSISNMIRAPSGHWSLFKIVSIAIKSNIYEFSLFDLSKVLIVYSNYSYQ